MFLAPVVVCRRCSKLLKTFGRLPGDCENAGADVAVRERDGHQAREDLRVGREAVHRRELVEGVARALVARAPVELHQDGEGDVRRLVAVADLEPVTVSQMLV